MKDVENKEFDKIKCKYISCYAGMGVAGNLNCFLKGDYENPNCEKYKNDRGEQLKGEVQEYLNEITGEERLYFINDAFDGFCYDCGDKTSYCNCTRDD